MSGQSLTYLVVASQEARQSLRAAAAPWLSSGLCRNFIIITAAALASPTDPVGRWAVGVEEEVACLQAAASRPYQTVRVVAYQEVPAGSSGDEQVVRQAWELHERLRVLMSPAQELFAINLLVPDNRVQGLPTDLLNLHMTANVIVAPEDRASPGRVSHHLEEGWRLTSHGVMNLLSVAGLWSHQEHGPLDTTELTSFAEVHHVVVVRSFGRVVRDPDLVRRVTQRVFAQRTDPGFMARSMDARVAEDAAHLVAVQAEALIQRHNTVLTASGYQPAVAPRLQQVGIWQALVMMFTFIFQGLRQLPGKVARNVTEAVHRAVGSFTQEIVFGSRSTMRVRRPDDEHAPPADQVDQVHDIAATLLQRAGGASAVPPANGELWRDLRQLSLALQDGAPLPAGFADPLAGMTREFLADPWAVVPDPAEGPFQPAVDGFPLPDSATLHIRPCDLLQAAHLEAELEALLAPPATQGDQPTVEPVRGLPTPEEAAAVKQEIGRLKRWLGRRQSSLVGRVMGHLAAQIDEGRTVLYRSLQRVSEGAPDRLAELEVAAHKKLLRRWFATTTLAVGISAIRLIIVWTVPIYVDGNGVIRWVGICLAILLVIYAAAFIAYQRTVFKVRHMLEVGLAEFDAALRSAMEAAKSLLVLSANYRMMRDWSEILGWLSHHPDAPLDAAPDQLPSGTDVLPASHRIGYVVEGDKNDPRLAAKVGRQVLGRGWLSNAFVEAAQAEMRGLRFHLALDAEPDLDWATGDPDPRVHMLTALSSRRVAREWTELRLEQVGAMLTDTDAHDLFQTVKDLTDGKVVDGAQFFHEPLEDFLPHAAGPASLAQTAWVPHARMGRSDQIVAVGVWSTAPVGEVVGEPAICHDPLPNSRSGRAGYEVVIVRFDRTSSVPASDLLLFSDGRPDEAPPVRDPIDDSVVW